MVGSEAPLRPLQDPFLLVEDGRGAQSPVGGGFADRSPVSAPGDTVGDGSGDVDAARRGDLVGEAFQPADESFGVDGDGGGEVGGELADQLGGPPRRLPLRQRDEGLVHQLGDPSPIQSHPPPLAAEHTGEETLRLEPERL